MKNLNNFQHHATRNTNNSIHELSNYYRYRKPEIIPVNLEVNSYHTTFHLSSATEVILLKKNLIFDDQKKFNQNGKIKTSALFNTASYFIMNLDIAEPILKKLRIIQATPGHIDFIDYSDIPASPNIVNGFLNILKKMNMIAVEGTSVRGALVKVICKDSSFIQNGWLTLGLTSIIETRMNPKELFYSCKLTSIPDKNSINNVSIITNIDNKLRFYIICPNSCPNNKQLRSITESINRLKSSVAIIVGSSADKSSIFNDIKNNIHPTVKDFEILTLREFIRY